MMRWSGIRRKVFVSFYGGDEQAVHNFLRSAEPVFIPRVLHEAYNGELVNSTNTEYVMGVIRREFLEDTSITLLMMGTCTHARRYVDWELKASLRQGDDSYPNGLLAVSLPSAPRALFLPPRFQENWRQDGSGYAQWYAAPRSSEELGVWLDDAFAARSARAHLIRNSVDMMANNRSCRVCGITH